jgi:hypothetical protein
VDEKTPRQGVNMKLPAGAGERLNEKIIKTFFTAEGAEEILKSGWIVSALFAALREQWSSFG